MNESFEAWLDYVEKHYTISDADRKLLEQNICPKCGSALLLDIMSCDQAEPEITITVAAKCPDCFTLWIRKAHTMAPEAQG